MPTHWLSLNCSVSGSVEKNLPTPHLNQQRAVASKSRCSLAHYSSPRRPASGMGNYGGQLQGWVTMEASFKRPASRLGNKEASFRDE